MYPSRKNYLNGLSSLGMLLILHAQASATSQEKPNILVFLGDDLTWSDCSAYGNTDIHTPNIQRLANEGICFDNMYTSTAMCAPSRQQLYSGLYPVRSGAYPNHSVMYEGVRSFAGYFTDLDYRVGLIGKKHYGPEEAFPLEYFGGRHHDNGEGVDIQLGNVREFIEVPDDKPFFLVVAQNQPHSPWNRGNRDTYRDAELKVPPYLLDTKRTRQELVNYYAEISYADSLLGVCLDMIDNAGKFANTIVIFTSEQGSSLPFGKWTCYEQGLKTAFIMRWPGHVKPGSRNPILAQYVDVLPTLLEIAGENPGKLQTGASVVNNDRGFDGRSFYDVLLGKKTKHRNYVFGIQTSRGIIAGPEAYAIRSVRDNRYKLIWNIHADSTFSNMVTHSQKGIYRDWLDQTADGPGWQRVLWYEKRPEFELYDLLEDPFELVNLAEEPGFSGVKKKLERVLQKWMKSQGDLGHETEMAATTRQVEPE